MPARFATERYSIQSNNGNPKSTTAKTSTKSKSKDHLSALERRVEHWESVEPGESLKEDETIQKCLKTSNTTSTVNEISTKFSCNIRTGNHIVQLNY